MDLINGSEQPLVSRRETGNSIFFAQNAPARILSARKPHNEPTIIHEMSSKLGSRSISKDPINPNKISCTKNREPSHMPRTNHDKIYERLVNPDLFPPGKLR